jgi:arylsulfatase A-like enzyme/Flp pilus assembly protein TadD
LLIVTLDTTRADHFGYSGSEEVKTPVMDGLAEESLVFLNTTTVVPLTLPAHSSLFTGVYPFTHGVRDNMGYELPDESVTLAEVLKDAGWQTAGFISAYVLHSGFGIAQGFDHYSDIFEFEKGAVVSPGSVQRDGSDTLEESLAWLEENHERPFFLWIHLFDPHVPYTPPEPFASQYPKDRYAAEIAYTDSLVGKITDKLDALGRADDTILTIIGDHGEGRGDHKESFHGLFIYDESIQVPCLIRAPGIAARRIDAQVRIIDIMPTLLALMGLPAHSDSEESLLAGQNLMPLITGQKTDLKLPAYAETNYPSTHFGWSDLKGLRIGGYKYIEAPKPELYDLNADPGEKENLVDKRPEIVKQMRATLAEIERRTGGGRNSHREKDDDDARSQAALRALGYTGVTQPAAGQDGKPLPDPKDKVDILNTLETGQGLVAMGKPFKALPYLKEVVTKEPNMTDGLVTMAVALYKIEDYELAVKMLERTIKIAPDMFAAWMNLAMCFEKMGRIDEAIKAYERSLELDPTNLDAIGSIIDSYFRQGKFNKAVELCERYLDQNPNDARIHGVMAMSLFNRGKSKEAMQHAQAGLAIDPEAQNLNYVMGKVFQVRMKWRDSAAAYEKEIALFKNNLNAYHSLAIVCEKLGDPERAIPALEEAIIHFPKDFNCHFILAKAYEETGRTGDEQIAVAKRAVELNSSSREAWDVLETLQKMKK